MVSFEFSKKKKLTVSSPSSKQPLLFYIQKLKFFKWDKPWTWELTPNDQTVGDLNSSLIQKKETRKIKIVISLVWGGFCLIATSPHTAFTTSPP